MTISTLEEMTTDSVVGMGRVAVARGPVRLTSVVGSCIGVAIHHPRLGVGGLAHVVLAASQGRTDSPGKYADTAIPHLLTRLAAAGAVGPAGLVVKIAGGAHLFGPRGPMQVGDENASAILVALTKARMAVAAQDVGGGKGRRITLDCATGALVVEVVGQPPLLL
jgi:chemotaxis protein CheD